MGLKERRAIKAFQEGIFPGVKEQINQTAGYELSMDIQWETMVEDRFAHLYHETYINIYFKPLIEAIKAICIDDFGKKILKQGLQQVCIKNEGNNFSPEKGYALENGVLTINLDPVVNADNISPRVSVLTDLLERKLEDSIPSESMCKEDEIQQETGKQTEPTVSSDDLLCQHAGLSFEKQKYCEEITGGKAWDFNLLDGKLKFDGELEISVQILGTYSPKQQSWMWGWANTQSGIPENLLTSSNHMREIGMANNIEEYTTPTSSFEYDPGHYYAMIASGVCSASCYYPVDFNGIKIYLLTYSEQLIKSEDTPTPIVISTFTQLISAMELAHKSSLCYYLQDKGFSIEPSGNNIIAKRDNEEIFALFNLKGNLMKITNK